MASKTPNFNLHKIDLTDAPPDITVLNGNFDTIDTQLKKALDGAAKAHASTHAIGGSDPITPASIGAVSKSGDTVDGTLVADSFELGEQNGWELHLDMDGWDEYVRLFFINNNKDSRGILFLRPTGLSFVDKNLNEYPLVHTGNIGQYMGMATASIE